MGSELYFLRTGTVFMNGERVGEKRSIRKARRIPEDIQYGGEKLMGEKQRIVIAEDHTILGKD